MTNKRVIKAAAKQVQSTIALVADVVIEAAAGEGESAKLPSFSVQAYNGGPLMVKNYELPVIIDLKGMETAKSITANLHHEKNQIVGHVTDKQNDGRKLLLAGIVSGTGAAAQEFLGNASNGYPWQASVEALPTSKPVLIAAGRSVEVNGQTFQGPVLVARKSKLFGVAFLPRGADEGTSVTIAASAADSSKEIEMEFAKWIEAMGFDPAELTDKQKAALQQRYDAEVKAAADNGKDIKAEGESLVPTFDADDIKAAASDHLASLEAIFAEHEGEVKADKFAEIRAEATKAAKELKVKAMKERWLAPRYEAELIRAAAQTELKLVRAERPSGPAIHSSSRIEASNEVIEAALCQTLNVPDYEKAFDEKTLEAAHKNFRRMGLQQAIIMAAAANGHQLHQGERLNDGNLRTVLRHAFAPIEAAFSTVSLPGIFSNVANKELLAGYMEEDQTWREIAQIRTVTDFKAVTSYRLLDNMEYEELAKGGEIKHGSVGEESYTRQARTYAKMFSLDRVDIINDDLGAFEDLRNRLGRGAAKKFNNLFWAEFMDNSSFFTSARANYITGATTDLGTDGVGLQAGITAFRKLRSPSADGEKRLGPVVGGRAEILLVPPELEFNAQKLHQNTNIGGGTTVANANIHAGKYRPVVCDWLSDSDFTGNSSTAWYLLRAPSNMAAVVVSFLNGMQTPTVESADADFNMLGIQFRGYHDFGVDQAEYLCGIKSKGAA